MRVVSQIMERDLIRLNQGEEAGYRCVWTISNSLALPFSLHQCDQPKKKGKTSNSRLGSEWTHFDFLMEEGNNYEILQLSQMSPITWYGSDNVCVCVFK